MSNVYTQTIVCLANSRKLSGRCIAGKEYVNNTVGEWIRPVSKSPTGEISEVDRRFQDGTDPKVLDIINVVMIKPQPHGIQSENHLIDDGYYWSLVGKATWAEVLSMIDVVPGVLWDNSSSSYNGLHDRLDEARAVQYAAALPGSLKLIRVADLEIIVAVEGAEFGNGKRKVRGRFSHNGCKYILSITDPVVERNYLAGQDGKNFVGDAVLCISLGEPYSGYIYKLIATVLVPTT
jgi:hypothetical protein